MEPINFMSKDGTHKVMFRTRIWVQFITPDLREFYYSYWPMGIRGALTNGSMITHELRTVGSLWNH